VHKGSKEERREKKVRAEKEKKRVERDEKIRSLILADKGVQHNMGEA
jgi:hypothetical protein